jgi:hypothetical protein
MRESKESKEVENKTVILTAGGVQDLLTKELDDHIRSLPIFKQKAVLENSLIKLSEMITISTGELSEVAAKLDEIQSKINSAAIEDLPSLSKIKAGIITAKGEGEVLLNDLEARKAGIVSEMEAISKQVEIEIRGYLQNRRISFSKELFAIIQNTAEPLLEGWNLFSSSKNCFTEVKIFSPLLSRSLKGMMSINDLNDVLKTQS